MDVCTSSQLGNYSSVDNVHVDDAKVYLVDADK